MRDARDFPANFWPYATLLFTMCYLPCCNSQLDDVGFALLTLAAAATGIAIVTVPCVLPAASWPVAVIATAREAVSPCSETSTTAGAVGLKATPFGGVIFNVVAGTGDDSAALA